MLTFHNATNFDELASIVERLSNEIGRMREAGPLSFADVQKAASALTRAQLVLNELERVELCDRGVSRELAERFVALENRMRTLRDDIYHDMQCRRPGPL